MREQFSMAENVQIVISIKPKHVNKFLNQSADIISNPARKKNRLHTTQTQGRPGKEHSTPAKKPRQSNTNKEKNNREWKCGECKLTFSTWVHLNMHVTSAHVKTQEKGKWQCGDCGRNYSTKGNLHRHVNEKHSVESPKKVAAVSVKAGVIEQKALLVGTLKKHLIQYECLHCRKTEDTYDVSVRHAQEHLVHEALNIENGNQYKLPFDRRHNGGDVYKGDDKNGTLKAIFDYKTLLKDTWFDLFKDLSISPQIIASSLYKNTRSIKLNWDSGSTDDREGKWVPMYQCDACKLFVEPAKVQNHCENYEACVALEPHGHKCTECHKLFYTLKALRLHKEDHENNKPLIVRIATFNHKDDVLFNKALKRVFHSSVSDAYTKEQEQISRNIETPEINGLEKNVSVQPTSQNNVETLIQLYCAQCRGFYSDSIKHSADHEFDRKRRMDEILREKQPSCWTEVSATAANKRNNGTTGKEADPEEIVSHNDNTRSDSDINGSNGQAHNKCTAEASSKNDDDIRMENYLESSVMEWDSDNDSDDNNLQSDNLRRVTKEAEIMLNTNNDNINVEKNEDHRVPEDDTGTVHSRDKSGENEDFDKRHREVQAHIETTVNTGAVENSVSGEGGGSLESSANYVTLNNNMAILCGSFHQGDLRFKSSRDKQCTAIAAVACAAFFVLDPNAWSKSIIDKIVTIGDKYYNDSIASRNSPALGEINPDYLAVTDLMPKITYYGKNVSVSVLEGTNFNGHIDTDNSNKGFPNLRNALKIFFRHHASGILTANATSVAVYCKTLTVDPMFWLFDSHSRGPEGVEASRGAACCMRFSHLDDLYSLLRRNLFVCPNVVPKGHDLINLNVFSLTPLNIRPPN